MLITKASHTRQSDSNHFKHTEKQIVEVKIYQQRSATRRESTLCSRMFNLKYDYS